MSNSGADAYFRKLAKEQGFSDNEVDDYIKSTSPQIDEVKPSYQNQSSIKPTTDMTVGEANDLLMKTVFKKINDPIQTSVVAPTSINSWDDFKKVAAQVAQEESYPASVLLGQAALETGRNLNNAQGYNFFGIKGSGDAGTQLQNTWEDYGNGPVGIQDNFARYNSPQAAVRAYIKLIKDKYPHAMAYSNDPQRMIQAIKEGGYATDPDYVSKVTSMPEFNEYLPKVNSAISSRPTPNQLLGFEGINSNNVLKMLGR